MKTGILFSRVIIATLSVISGQSWAALGEVRSIDGTGNNLDHPTWGAANTNLIRIAPADYPDGFGASIIEPPLRPNVRDISNAISKQEKTIYNKRRLSDMTWQWGQFLDHDIDLTGNGIANGPAHIMINGTDDPLYPIIPLIRSNFDPITGIGPGNPRQQMNKIPAFIDASNVYGSDTLRADFLRADGGYMKTSDHDLLPFNIDGFPNAGGPDPSLFLAGDVRANEQVGLTAMHTLFVREHNRLVDKLATRHPDYSDEQLYQTARKIVGAEMQIVTCREFLPALLGKRAVKKALGTKGKGHGHHHRHGKRSRSIYDPDVNASIANEFSTAVYRFGHSMLSSDLKLIKEDGTTDELPLKDAFFDPSFFDEAANLNYVLKGLTKQRAQEIDAKLVDAVRDFLFGEPGAGGADLAALNEQRGRDHGLSDYNTMRHYYGLDPVDDWVQISSDTHVQVALEETYGDIDHIDAWVGLLAEDHHYGSVGELAGEAILEQFIRLRSGDRFFYLNDPDLFDRDIRKIINLDKITLSKIIRYNTDIKGLQKNVFFVPSKRGRSVIPEPTTLALADLGLMGLSWRRRKPRCNNT